MSRIKLVHVLYTEFALYLGGLLALWLGLGARLGVATTVALTALVCMRVFSTAMLFVIAYRCRGEAPPDMRIGPWCAAKLVASEFCALFLFFTLFQPFERLLVPRNTRSDGSSGNPPVILIHGFFCNGGFWWWLRGQLLREGIQDLYTINLYPILGSINRFSRQLATRIEEVKEATGADKVVLVGHSMGGLVSRAYVQYGGGAENVAKIVTLGTPHHGTAHAQLFAGNDVAQMRRTNAWLDRLNEGEDHPAPVPITSVFSYHDNVIAPQDSSILAHAENIPLSGVGHLAMGFSRQVADILVREIRAQGRQC